MSNAAIPVYLVPDDELKKNGGTYAVVGTAAFPISGQVNPGAGSVETGDIEDEAVTIDKIGSGATPAGRVIQSDGAGGATWAAGGGGGGISDVGELSAAGYVEGDMPRWNGATFEPSPDYTNTEVDAIAVAEAAAVGTAAATALSDHTALTNPHGTSKADVGLGNVTNVDHAAALATHAALQNNPHAVNAAQVGLGNVTNVDHAAALATHAALPNPHGTSKADVGLGNVTNVDHAAALATHAGLTNNPHGVTAAQVGAYTTTQANDHFAPAGETLTDGATITWAFANAKAKLAKVTLTGSPRTIDITNCPDGGSGVLIVFQDATGNRAIILPANSYIVGDSAVIDTAANAISMLSFVKHGSDYFWTKGLNVGQP